MATAGTGRGACRRLNKTTCAQALGDQRPVLITVHGTNDADGTSEGARWWQRGSTFLGALGAALTARGTTEAVVTPFHWSGENSDDERLDAGKALAKVMRRLDKSSRPYHVLAHSHGGNVVLEAFNQFTRKGRAPKMLGAVTTLGTPYFARKLRRQSFSFAVYRMLLSLVLFAAAAASAVLGVALIVDAAARADVGVAWISIMFVFAALLAWPGVAVFRNALRVMRENSRLKKWFDAEGARWRAIWATRDEAIGMLVRVNELKPTFITAKSMRRSLDRMMTTLAAVAAVPLTFFTYGRVRDWTLANWEPNQTQLPELGTMGHTVSVLIASSAAIPLAIVYFAILFLLGLIFTRIGPQFVAAHMANSSIRGGLTSGALGEDSRYRLIGVTPLPNLTENAAETVIDRETLGDVDPEDAGAAMKQFYDTVIRHDPDRQAPADPDALWNTLNNAFYHNGYFADREVIDTVAGPHGGVWGGGGRHLAAREGQPPRIASVGVHHPDFARARGARRESDFGSVGRQLRRLVEVGVVGDLRQVGAVGFDRPDFRRAPGGVAVEALAVRVLSRAAVEHDRRARRRPARDAVGARIFGQPRLARAVGVHDVDLGVAVARGDERDARPVGRKTTAFG